MKTQWLHLPTGWADLSPNFPLPKPRLPALPPDLADLSVNAPGLPSDLAHLAGNCSRLAAELLPLSVNVPGLSPDLAHLAADLEALKGNFPALTEEF